MKSDYFMDKDLQVQLNHLKMTVTNCSNITKNFQEIQMVQDKYHVIIYSFQWNQIYYFFILALKSVCPLASTIEIVSVNINSNINHQLFMWSICLLKTKITCQWSRGSEGEVSQIWRDHRETLLQKHVKDKTWELPFQLIPGRPQSTTSCF